MPKPGKPSFADNRYTAKQAGDAAFSKVMLARAEGIALHGHLKAGPVRWNRLISEEYREVMDELETIDALQTVDVSERDDNWKQAKADADERAVHELAQLSQLCIGTMELIYRGRTKEE